MTSQQFEVAVDTGTLWIDVRLLKNGSAWTHWPMMSGGPSCGSSTPESACGSATTNPGSPSP